MYPVKSATNRNWTVIGMVAAGALALLAVLLLVLRPGAGVLTSSAPARAHSNSAAAEMVKPQAVPVPKPGYNEAQSRKASAASSAPKSIDLGGGYTLRQDRAGGQIIAPATVLKPQSAPSASTIPVTGSAASIASGATTYGLANGYTMVINEDGKHLLLSPSALKGRTGQTVENTSTIPVTGSAPTKTLDLGGGYTLTLNATGGQINPPAAVLKSSPAASSSTVMTTDMGNGYTLVEDENGRHVILSAAAMQGHISQLNNGSVPVTGQNRAKDNRLGDGYSLLGRNSQHNPSSAVRTYIGGGFWLVTDPDGRIVVTH